MRIQLSHRFLSLLSLQAPFPWATCPHFLVIAMNTRSITWLRDRACFAFGIEMISEGWTMVDELVLAEVQLAKSY